MASNDELNQSTDDESYHVHFNSVDDRMYSEEIGFSETRRRKQHKSFVISNNIREAQVTPSSKYLSSTSNKFPLFAVVIGWLFFCTIVAACLIYIIEGHKTSIFRCFFLSTSAFTNSGLNTIAINTLKPASLSILCCLGLCGSTCMLSLIPVRVRMHFLERHIPLDLRTFTLSNFKVVPHWVVEYKALQFIFRLVLIYQLIFLFFGAISILLLCEWCGDGRVNYADDHGYVATRTGFSVFTSIMAFTNSGISLRPVFRNVTPWLLIIVDILCLAGNTMFPIFLRWFIILCSKCSKVDSNRKVYFRYLLMAGRNHYTHLFTSQQTWTLVSLQFFFLFFQSIVGHFLGTHINMNQAIFMSINTRHAGFSSVYLEDQNSGILVLFLAMMFLAPTPFVVVLNHSLKGQDNLTDSMIPREASFRPSSLMFDRPDTSDDESDDSVIVSKFDNEEPLRCEGSPNSANQDLENIHDLESDDESKVKPREKLSRGSHGDSLVSVELDQPNTGYSNRRLASRVLAMGLVENCEDPSVDTRMRLLKLHNGEKVPYSEMISTRAVALKESLLTLWHDANRASMARSLGMLWFVWFLILSIEQYKPDDANSSIFNTLFEICSAFGNVGLSIGSLTKKNCSFSADLTIWSQILIIAVMIQGKTRELPPAIDGSLMVNAGDLVSASFLRPGAVVRTSPRSSFASSVRQSEGLVKLQSIWCCDCWDEDKIRKASLEKDVQGAIQDSLHKSLI